MLFSGNDFIDTASSFDTAVKAGTDGKMFVRAYATSGAGLKTPQMVLWHGSGYAATALAAGARAHVGVPEEAIASGCVGWIQVRGYASNVQGAATSLTAGSFGHAIYWGGATGIGCSASAYVGVASQIGVLMEDLGAAANSTTANIWLNGNLGTSI